MRGNGFPDLNNTEIVAPEEVDQKGMTEKTKTTEMMMGMGRMKEPQRQESGLRKTIGPSGMVETPGNGSKLTNLSKCSKESSRKLKGGGPNSGSKKKDGKGKTDSSQRTINFYFNGIGATQGRGSLGSSTTNINAKRMEAMSSVLL